MDERVVVLVRFAETDMESGSRVTVSVMLTDACCVKLCEGDAVPRETETLRVASTVAEEEVVVLRVEDDVGDRDTDAELVGCILTDRVAESVGEKVEDPEPVEERDLESVSVIVPDCVEVAVVLTVLDDVGDNDEEYVGDLECELETVSESDTECEILFVLDAFRLMVIVSD